MTPPGLWTSVWKMSNMLLDYHYSLTRHHRNAEMNLKILQPEASPFSSEEDGQRNN